jgi:hypothetical protein
MEDNLKTFTEIVKEQEGFDLMPLIQECMDTELTADDEALIEASYQEFCESEMTLGDLEHEIVNEGMFGSILGGLTGLALGKSIGKMVARALGIKNGILYDLLTSRLVGAALGSSIGKKFL